jgi:ribosomal protein S18 acetylase RimI-like enzyme
MASGSYERMIQLAEESFHTSEDPSAIVVTDTLLGRLRHMHSSTVSEECDEAGPVAWVLLLPTTHELIVRFLDKSLSERQLFEATPDDATYDALYMCSALVLPEYRRRGIARRLIVDAVRSIGKDQPISELAFWPFSIEGRLLAESAARECRLPLFGRER